jgi:anti-sigma regulatory factor (Ser/Thr protein kinase)
MSATLEFEPLASSVRSARLFVVDKLQEWRCDDLVETVALLTSELATNAVVHTGQPYSVHVERRGPGVRVEVVDLDPELPRRRDLIDLDAVAADLGHEPAAPEIPFSGLGIVDRTASAWGSEASGRGKVVWFEVMRSAEREGERRTRIADLRDLRDPVGSPGLLPLGLGEERPRIPPSQEAPVMARHEYLVDDDDRVIERSDRRGGGVGRILLLLLAIGAVAVAAFFLFGGSADVDSEGDLEVPEVDVDVNAPDVNVDSEEAPPASADAN